jgi:hypothetical protein
MRRYRGAKDKKHVLRKVKVKVKNKNKGIKG